MPAITIELPEDMYAKLAAVAAQQTESVESVVLHALEDKVRAADEARAMAREDYQQFRRLFDRLKE